MMSENQARETLRVLDEKYLPNDKSLVEIINDFGRPGLPIRGFLERVRLYGLTDINESDKEIIEELLYLYG